MAPRCEGGSGRLAREAREKHFLFRSRASSVRGLMAGRERQGYVTSTTRVCRTRSDPKRRSPLRHAVMSVHLVVQACW